MSKRKMVGNRKGNGNGLVYDIKIPTFQKQSLITITLMGDYPHNVHWKITAQLHEHDIVCGKHDVIMSRSVLVVITNDAKHVKTLIQATLKNCKVQGQVECQFLQHIPIPIIQSILWTQIPLELRDSGVVIAGHKEQSVFVLSNQFKSGDVQCVSIEKMMMKSADDHHTIVSIHVNPIMKQLILLNDRIPSKEKDVSVFALPRFTRCSVISDVFDDVPDAISSLSHDLGMEPQDVHTFVPRTEEEFREYWLQMHGMVLPSILSYVYVQFMYGNVMIYPTCCLATTWEKRMEMNKEGNSEILDEFTAILKRTFHHVQVTSVTETSVPTAGFMSAKKLCI